MFTNEKGFSLLELMVSITIFAMISTLFLANFRGGENQRVLKLSAQNVGEIFRKTQFWAQHGKTWFVEGIDQVPSGGYGIFLEVCAVSPCQITVFGDLDGELDFDGVEEMRGEEYILPEDIIVESVSPISPTEVVFKPPLPSVCVNRDCSNIGFVSVLLRNLKNNSTATIRLDQKTGQISVN
ncbi:MAG: hypothetical protein G01um101418_610 [Parcubacteria group bacterium Gr01-1014_18]|nr:MAG: hypothetical protein Greene041636_99 [Parcubacteria group bacterium Greene0416_36]TSC80862.1 MAG: hypothetical protein G01um101418_610 [Parcubacteria group bacterium Gr01-1014_18]TSC99523.1 MAG: hypothetical protein Greene101420_190 [Parcubacteria group bacterium Greene1014_20]TSD07558.1 MAG: hypothetical protein Greene07142_15 [Parcubacteria group bacterium Greene0714_2]